MNKHHDTTSLAGRTIPNASGRQEVSRRNKALVALIFAVGIIAVGALMSTEELSALRMLAVPIILAVIFVGALAVERRGRRAMVPARVPSGHNRTEAAHR
jgi:uncharacterized membrane protein YoaK (UPF0700 family)